MRCLKYNSSFALLVCYIGLKHVNIILCIIFYKFLQKSAMLNFLIQQYAKNIIKFCKHTYIKKNLYLQFFIKGLKFEFSNDIFEYIQSIYKGLKLLFRLDSGCQFYRLYC